MIPKVLVKLTKLSKGLATTKINCDAYPFVFKAAVLQRSIDDRIIKQERGVIVIGSDTPPVRVMIIETRFFRSTRQCTMICTSPYRWDQHWQAEWHR